MAERTFSLQDLKSLSIVTIGTHPGFLLHPSLAEERHHPHFIQDYPLEALNPSLG
jgi:hypothetical protein